MDELVRALLELHKPVEYPYYRLGSVLQCEECASLCHSHSGLQCEEPIDAQWPCETVKLIQAHTATP